MRAILFAVFALQASGGFALDLSRQPTQLVQRHWTSEDGVPAEVAWALHQSSDGYLWVATDNGLARFDGLTFKVFGVTTHDAFKSNDIRDVTEGPDGTIWAGSVGSGLLRIRDGSVRRFDGSHGLVSDAVYSVLVTSNGDTWAGTASGACRLREERMQCWTEADGLASGRIVRLAEDAQGRIWFASITDGLSMYDGKAIVRYGIEDGLQSLDVPMIIAHPEHNILLGTSTGELYAASPSGIKLLDSSELPDAFAAFNAIVDRDGNILIGAFGGLWQYYPKVQRIDNPEDNISYVLDMVEDTDGTLWVATSTGLFQYSPGAFIPYGKPEGVADETFVVAAGVDGSVWTGTELSGMFNVYPDGTVYQYTTAEGLPLNSISALMVDPDGLVWAGTFGVGIALLRDGEVIDVISSDDGLPGNQIGSIHRDSEGAVWIGTNAGLARWVDGEVTLTRTAADGLPANLVRDIREDRERKLYLSGDNGLAVLSLESLEVIETINSANGLANDVVATTFVDDRGIVWIGTRSGGLSRLENNNLFRFDMEHEVGLTSVMSIMEDAGGFFWLAGRDGVVRVPRNELDAVASGRADKVTSVSFGTSDGLRSTRIPGGYQSAAVQATDGQIWFATGRGLVSVEPSALKPLASPAAVSIDAIRADGVTIAGEPPYQIPAGTQSVQIDYSVPSLNNAESLRFRYRLGNGRWQDAGDRRTAFFTSLAPRNQRFEVAAVYDGQAFSKQSSAVEMFVEPLWYQTHLATVLAALAFSWSVWLCYRLTVRNYRQRQAQLEQLVNERTVALQKALEDVEKVSRTDILTGVANRRHFEERMREVWSRAIREEQSVSIMMIDIDHFKKFNDANGHQDGDHCLAAVAHALCASVREEDFVARYGGEEFVVLLAGSDIAAVCEIGKRLQDGVRALQIPHPGLDDGANVTVSAGFASSNPKAGDVPEDLLRRADGALYRAKEQGRDRVIVDSGFGEDSLTITRALALPS